MASRRFLQDVPIRQKLRIIILIISGLCVAGACGLFVTYQWITSREQRAQRIAILAEVVGTQVLPAVEFDQESEAGSILASLRADPRIVAAAVYRENGSLFASYRREGGEAVPERAEAAGTRLAGGHILVFRTMKSEDHLSGTIHIRADLQDVNAQLWTNILVVAVLLAAASAAVLFLSGRLGRLITEPIQRLSEVVQSVGTNKDYSLRVSGKGRDEVGRLIEGFNDMIRAVEEREAALAKARDELEARVRERTKELEQEVAERREAEKRLKENEDRLNEAQQIAQLGSWTWDPGTNTVDWSDELFRIMGTLPTRFSGTYDDAALLIHPDDRERLRKEMEGSRDRREPFECGVRNIRPDGAVRHLHLLGKPVLDAAGKTVRLIGTAQDVTERKRAEQAIQKLNTELQDRVEEAAAANKELEGFSYSVSHDLRAPLRAIHGYSRMLMEDHAERIDGEGRRFLEVITQNTRRMGQLIDDLLDFSRLGRKAISASLVDMEGLVRQVCDEAKSAAPDRRIEFEIGALPPAHGDPSMLRIALTNLVSNAVKYTKGRDPAVIRIGSRSENGETWYVLQDNGVGFQMEYAHKLFGVFQRLHKSDEFEGTGVGLALVQRILQRHGGRVTAEGRVGAGATFSFTLPPPSAGGREV